MVVEQHAGDSIVSAEAYNSIDVSHYKLKQSTQFVQQINLCNKFFVAKIRKMLSTDIYSYTLSVIDSIIERVISTEYK